MASQYLNNALEQRASMLRVWPGVRLSQAIALAGRLILPAAFVFLACFDAGFLDRTPNFCIYRSLFGVRCLGCGMTHAFCAVLHGDLVSAFSYNPLVIVAFPFFSVIAVRHLYSLCRDLWQLWAAQVLEWRAAG